jgi:hypothetical protein
VEHFFFSKKVIKVFRNDKNDVDYNLGAYLEGGIVSVIDMEDEGAWKMKEKS